MLDRIYEHKNSIERLLSDASSLLSLDGKWNLIDKISLLLSFSTTTVIIRKKCFSSEHYFIGTNPVAAYDQVIQKFKMF